MADPIVFLGTVAKAQTLADGGLRFTFDTGEGELMALAQIVACKQAGAVLRITCEIESCTDLDNEAKKEPKGSGDPMGCRGRTIRRD